MHVGLLSTILLLMPNIPCQGETIIKLRTQQGWTQDKLAIMSNGNIRTIQRAERGEHLQLENVASIAAALKVTVPALTVPDDATDAVQGGNEGDDRENNAVVLRPVASGKTLLDMVYDSFTASLDCQVEPTAENIDALTAIVDKIEWLMPNPWVSPLEQARLTLADRLRRSVDLSAMLAELGQFGIAVFAGTYTASAQMPYFDQDEGTMVTRLRAPYQPVTICRVTLEMRDKERVVVMVTDKWEPPPDKPEADDDIPF